MTRTRLLDVMRILFRHKRSMHEENNSREAERKSKEEE